MKRSASFILSFVLVSSHAIARLGETPEQTAQRYGPVTTPYSDKTLGKMGYLYETNDLDVEIVFLAGRDAYEFYAPTNGVLTQGRIRELLKLNEGDGSWQKDADLTNSWTRTDDGSVAFALDDLGGLIFYSGPFWKSHVGEKTAKASSSLLPPPAPQSDPAPCLTAGAPGSRIIDANEFYTTISILINVRNSCPTPIDARVSVQALDAQGFEIDHFYIDGAVPANATTTITGRDMLRRELAAQVAKWQVKSVGEK